MELKNTLKGFEQDKLEYQRYLMLEKIHEEINRINGYENGLIFQDKKTWKIVEDRYLFYYLAVKHTDLSLTQIGNYKSKRTHSTVIHGINKIKDLLTIDKNLRIKVEIIEKNIKIDNGLTLFKKHHTKEYSNG